MRKLVEFLLARCDTHPEEFYEERKSGVKHNWLHHVKTCKKFMTDEEYAAVWEKVSEINLNYVMERVTEKLFEPEDEELTEEAFAAALKNAYWANGQSTPSKIMMSQTQLELMKKQFYDQKKEIEEEVRKVRFNMEGRYESDKDNG